MLSTAERSKSRTDRGLLKVKQPASRERGSWRRYRAFERARRQGSDARVVTDDRDVIAILRAAHEAVALLAPSTAASTAASAHEQLMQAVGGARQVAEWAFPVG